MQKKFIYYGVAGFFLSVIFTTICVGLLVYFQPTPKVAQITEVRKYYGQIRIMKIGGEKLRWAPVLQRKEAEETKEKRATLQTYFAHNLVSTPSLLQNVSVKHFHEDKFSQLLGAKDRGVHVSFEITAVIPDHLSNVKFMEHFKSQILQAFHFSRDMEVDMDSFEFEQKPLIQPERFKTYESYLANDKVNIDLDLTELPGLKQPLKSFGNVTCPPFKPLFFLTQKDSDESLAELFNVSQPGQYTCVILPLHGFVSPLTCLSQPLNKLNQVCKFSCEDNYTVVGSRSISCLSTGSWSDNLPLCKAKCTPLQEIQNLVISPRSCVNDVSLADMRCHYTCETGMMLYGNPSRVCTDEGEWSGGVPLCKETCMPLSPPRNGHIWPKSCATVLLLSTGSYCTYFCDEGFVLAGSPSLHCDSDGSWNFPVPTCRIGCPTLIAPRNGTITPDTCVRPRYQSDVRPLLEEGVSCVYSCDKGFVLQGPEMRFCGADGGWTGADAYCAQLCPPLVLPHPMLATPGLCTDEEKSSKLAEGRICHLSCPNNYRTSNNITEVTCITNGVWTEIPRRCLRTCPEFGSIINGKMAPDSCSGLVKPVEGTTCVVKCEKGFDLKGIRSTTCSSTGKWTNQPAQCLKKCPVLRQIKHGALHPTNCTTVSFFQNERCRYTCDSGYGLFGVLQRICLTDGTWSSNEPHCEVENQFLIRQTSADHDICMTVNPVTLFVEKQRISSCSISNRAQSWVIMSNGLIKNVEYRRCIAAEHAQENAFLKLEECDPANILQIWAWQDDNGLRICLLNTDLEISHGYVSMGKVMLTPSGNTQLMPWYAVTHQGISSLYDMFTNITCQRLRRPMHTTVIPDKCTENQTLENQTICQFLCPPDRRLHGSDTRVCVNGKWTNLYPTCERTCEALQAPAAEGGSVTQICAVGRQDEGTVCQYSCKDPRFMLEGEGITICLENGEWSSPTPKCIVYCPMLPTVPRGVLFPPECATQKMRIDSICQLACDYPFVPVGLGEKTCLPWGNWSSVDFSCERGCPIPGPPHGYNGTVKCNTTSGNLSGDECIYSCEHIQHRALAFTNKTNGELYVASSPGPNGFISRVCQPNGLFNGSIPTCVAVCDHLLAPNDGILSPPNCIAGYSVEGTLCSLTCRTGYGVRGARHTRCLASGDWSETVFYCEEEIQFRLHNENFNLSCLNVNTSISSIDFRLEYEVYMSDPFDCKMQNSSIWTWRNNFLIQHVETGFCLSVLDKHALGETLLVLGDCDDSHIALKWMCSKENPLFLSLFEYDLYLHYSEADPDYAVAYRHLHSTPEDFYEEWLAEDVLISYAQKSSPCELHTEACAPFRAPDFSYAIGQYCDGESVAPVRAKCQVKCNPGYIFHNIFNNVVAAGCHPVSRRWKYSVSDDVLPLKCEKPCTPLTLLTGAVRVSDLCTNGRAFFNDVCKFSCINGLELIGVGSSVCGVDGKWSDPSPTCDRSCSHSKPPAHNLSMDANILATAVDCSYDENLYAQPIMAGTTCYYECDPPYFPASVMARECLLSGKFSHSHPTCYIPQTTVPYAYACEFGYSFGKGGSNVTHCRADTYTWGKPPSCTPTCPDKPPHCIGYGGGQTCTVSCDDDQVLTDGNPRVDCGHDGQWMGRIPRCVDRKQLRVAVAGRTYGNNPSIFYCLVSNGKISVRPNIHLIPCSMIEPNNTSALWSWEGAVVLRHKLSGYCLMSRKFSHGSRLGLGDCHVLEYRQQWQCSNNAKRPYVITSRYDSTYVWATNDYMSGNRTSELRLVHSSMLPKSDPDDVSDTTEIPGQYSWIALDPIYNSTDTMKTLCSSTATDLSDYLCPPLAAAIPRGGLMSPACSEKWSPLDQICDFQCMPGYERQTGTSSSTKCTKNGVWSTLYFRCVKACLALPKPQYGSLLCTPSHTALPVKGNKCTLSCDRGYEMFGGATRVCQYDGRWSGVEPFCAKRCPLLPMPKNAQVTPIQCSTSLSKVIPDTSCYYACNEEFELSSASMPGTSLRRSALRICYRNGTWSGNPLVCNRVCPPQIHPQNGMITPFTCVTGNSMSGYECKLICNDGYNVYGNDTRVCGKDGAWINSITADLGPPCRKSCSMLPYVSNVHYNCKANYTSITGSTVVIGTECSSVCAVGYGFTPGSIIKRICLPNGVWTGEDPVCILEKQFALFLDRFSTKSSTRPHVCIISDELGGVKKVDHLQCENAGGFNAYHRWSWYRLWKLKNAATGLCLSVKNLSLSAKVTTEPCDDPVYYSDWSCTGFRGDGRSWFLRILNSNFFPDFGFSHTDSIFLHNVSQLDPDVDDVDWYARSYSSQDHTSLMDQPKRTVCSNRDYFGICPPLLHPQFGNVHPSNCSSSEDSVSLYLKCSFECNVGYRLLGGPQTTECLPTGIWTALVPYCARICPSLDPLENGVVSPSSCVEPDLRVDSENEYITRDRYMAGLLHGESCSFQCDYGWRLVGLQVLTCLESGRWNGKQPTCKKLCPRLLWPDHATALDPTCLTSSKVYGETCTFKCHEGYGVPKTESSCGAGSVVLADTSSGEQFCEQFEHYTESTREKCREYDDEVFLTCTSDGMWVGDQPICFPLCDPLTYPEHGFVQPDTCSQHYQAVGSVCSYACEKQYTLRGNIVSFTCVDGKWIPTQKARESGFDITPYKSNYLQPMPACDKYCLPLSDHLGKHATMEPSECSLDRVEVGTICQLHCSSGHIVKGIDVVKCKDDGTWDDAFGSCEKKCRAIVTPDNGVVMPWLCTTSLNPDGTTCTFACFDKYAIDGEVSTLCDSKGKWSNPEPLCRRRCSPFPKFYNGAASPDQSCYSDRIVKGNTCSFACRTGFLLVGSPQLTCLENGNWDKAQPACQRICPLSIIPNGQLNCTIRGQTVGNSEISSFFPTWGSSCTVVCDSKYTPTHSAKFVCRSNGMWLPTLPECFPNSIPMYITQKGGDVTICLAENEETRTVVQIPKEQCFNPTKPTDRSVATWRWMGSHNIQNGKTGRCFSTRSLSEGEILRTELCNPNDPLQHWDCSTANAFQLVLKNTDLAPTTLYRDLQEIVLQRWNDWHSYFTTFDLQTYSQSSLCSRRPGGKCPPLPNIKFGGVQPALDCQSDWVNVGQMCRYKCFKNSIILRGSPYTICMLNGIWSNPPPVCGEYCPPLVEFPRMSYLNDSDCVFKSSPIGKICKGSCKRGFEAVGNVDIKCLASGTWSNFSFQCLPECAKIYGVVHGTVSPSPCTTNVCTFTCLPGYVLSTGTSIAHLTCDDGGRWTPDLPQCLRESQFRIIAKSGSGFEDVCLTAVNNSIGQPLIKTPCSSQDSHDATQLFKWRSEDNELLHAASGLCITGAVERFGNITLQSCVESPMQKWDCGEVPGVVDFSLHLKSKDFYLDMGAIVDRTSDIDPHSSLHRVVMETDYYPTSRWFAMHHFAKGTVCSLKENHQCPVFPDIQGATVVPSACKDVAFIIKGMICKVICDQGYTLQKSDKSACQQDGTWMLPLPACVGIHQCNPIVFTDMELKVSPSLCGSRAVVEGTRCYFSCRPDHHLIGESLLVCLLGGQWSSPTPRCRPQCAPLRYVPYATIIPELCYSANNNPGAVCNIACDDNSTHELLGSSNRKCIEDGSWSGEESVCITFCKAIVPPSSGVVYPDRCTSNGNFEENTCIFSCNEDFVLIGSERITCYEGKWDGNVPECAPLEVCERVVSGRDGVKEVFYKNLVSDVAIRYSTELTVVCEEGYILDGPPTRTCLGDGSWSFGTHTCLASCPPLLLPNYGVVFPHSCSYQYVQAGSTCTVVCDSGTFLVGQSLITCDLNGKWMQPLPYCDGEPTIINADQQRPFIVSQHDWETGKLYCLKVTRSERVQVTSDCQHVNFPPEYQFQWRGPWGLIESIAIPNYCWSLAYVNESQTNENAYFVTLVLDPCNQQRTVQHFQCDDVTLRQFALRLGAASLWIGRLRGDVDANPNVNLVESEYQHDLNWEAFLVDEIKNSSGITSNMEDAKKHSVCNLVCGGTLTAPEGTLQSPGYPIRYPRNTICRWHISTHMIIRLWITDIHLEYGMNGGSDFCEEDELSILEGSEATIDSSNVIAAVCGSSDSPIGPFTTYTGNLIVVFKSARRQTQRRGFRAQWSSEKYPKLLQGCDNTTQNAVSDDSFHEVEEKMNGKSVPWQAALFQGDSAHFLCGAVLISEKHALTAAHCVNHIKSRSDLSRVIIAFGSEHLWRLKRVVVQLLQEGMSVARLQNNGGATAHRFMDLFIHPRYDEDLKNDIAVLVVTTPFMKSDSTHPACLPPSNIIPQDLGKIGNLNIPKTYCAVAGWRSESEDGEADGRLNRVELPILSDRHCAFASTHAFGRVVDSKSIFCAGHIDGTRQSPCDMDEGGGFVCVWNDSFYVIGLTSQQLGDCSSLNAPRYFTRVAAYRDWIDDVKRRANVGLRSLLQ